LVGVAKTADVLRQGIVKYHIVFYAPAVLGLEQPDGSEECWFSLGLIAHEAGHIEERMHRDKTFPRADLRPPQFASREATQLTHVSEIAWEEYAACRLSAAFCESQLPTLLQTLIDVLNKAQVQANDAIIRYRRHASIPQVLAEAGTPLIEPLRLLGYVLGHLDGSGKDFDDLVEVSTALAATGYSEFASRFKVELRALWDSVGHWTSPSEFVAMNGIVRDVFVAGGLIFHTQPDGGLYVEIPFTPETTPAV
jgi:hypothetical protein